MKNPQLKIATAIIMGAGVFASTNAFANLYCGLDTNQNHVAAGRAVQEAYVNTKAVGSNDDMGLYYSDSSTLEETSEGFFTVVTSCDDEPKGSNNGAGTATPYEHAEETPMEEIFNKTGKYGIAAAGGHFVYGDNDKPPFDKIIDCNGFYPDPGCEQSISVPEGATIEHALLFYTGSIGLQGEDFTDFTTEGDNLHTADDAARNGVSLSIGSEKIGPLNPITNSSSSDSDIGSSAKITPDITFEFGTLQGTKTALYGNRIDITEYFTGKSGTIDFMVHAPENLDTSVNNINKNGDNKMGTTVFNECFSVGNWSLLIIYSHEDEAEKQVIVKDDFLQAWDYTYIHKGIWNRPKTTINHAPMAAGAKFYLYGATGLKAGYKLPEEPACTCGCGGKYNLKKVTYSYDTNDTSVYFTEEHLDPEIVRLSNDPMNRDRLNGPWELIKFGDHTTTTNSINGNDWTLFQSGENKYTEFPNLYEGEAVSADNIQPATNEDSSNSAADVYDGHPWSGRGTVTYHGAGNSVSVVEVEPVEEALEIGSTSSTFFFKGDQKDVFKPQARVTIRYIAMTVPINESKVVNKPEITLEGANPLELFEGDTFEEPGFTAVDAEDGDMTAMVSIDCIDFVVGETVSEGTYTCTYSATDVDNNTGLAERIVIVNPINPLNEPPVITLAGDNPLEITAGQLYLEPGYSAIDAEDDDITSNVEVECSFDITAALVEGSHSCQYNVKDSNDEAAETVIREINVITLPKPTCEDWYTSITEHVNSGRAYTVWGYAYTLGGNNYLGYNSAFSYKSVKRENPDTAIYTTGTCP